MLFTNSLHGTDNIKSEISFFRQTPVECPICETQIVVEEFKTGGGRLSAGELQSDLYRPYLPSEEYGDVFPLLYAVGTCPKCYFSAFWNNFKMHNKSLKAVSSKEAQDTREKALRTLFKEYPNFIGKKTLLSGLASYILAINSYEFFLAKEAPAIRQAVCSIRGAWICNLLHKYEYGIEFESLAKIFYRKALFFYGKALDFDTDGSQPLSAMKFLGPDTDRDYGYDGLVYLYAWLELNYGSRNNSLVRERKLNKIRSSLSRVFGFGKSSKDKPSVLLAVARETYEAMEEELKSYV